VQTWTRIRRHEFRALAHEIGNEAVSRLREWPASGEGREVKAASERIIRRLDGPQPVRNLKIVLGELNYALDQFLQIADNSFFKSVIADRRIGGKRSNRGPLGEELSKLIHEYSLIRDEQTQALELETKEAIRTALPEQKLSPVKFAFEDGILRIQDDIAQALNEDLNIAESSRTAVLEIGEEILDQFLGSNGDPRLANMITELQEALIGSGNIIRCALRRLALEKALPAFEQELAATIYGQIQAYSTGIGLYVSLFPDWQRFIANAADTDVNTYDVGQIYYAGRQMVAALETAGPSVDPEVPRTLNWIFEAIREPRLASKSAIFGAWRTLENLVSKIFGTSLDWIKAANKGVKLGLTASAGIAALTLVQQVATASTGISPKVAQAMHAGWIPKAAQSMLELIKPE